MATKEVICPHCDEVNVFTQIYLTTWITRFPDQENRTVILGCHDELDGAMETVFDTITGFKKKHPQLPPAEISQGTDVMGRNIVVITTEIVADKNDIVTHLGDFTITEVTLKTKTSHVH
jgi:hypothetical protein